MIPKSLPLELQLILRGSRKRPIQHPWDSRYPEMLHLAILEHLYGNALSKSDFCYMIGGSLKFTIPRMRYMISEGLFQITTRLDRTGREMGPPKQKMWITEKGKLQIKELQAKHIDDPVYKRQYNAIKAYLNERSPKARDPGFGTLE